MFRATVLGGVMCAALGDPEGSSRYTASYQQFMSSGGQDGASSSNLPVFSKRFVDEAPGSQSYSKYINGPAGLVAQGRQRSEGGGLSSQGASLATDHTKAYTHSSDEVAKGSASSSGQDFSNWQQYLQKYSRSIQQNSTSDSLATQARTVSPQDLLGLGVDTTEAELKAAREKAEDRIKQYVPKAFQKVALKEVEAKYKHALASLKAKLNATASISGKHNTSTASVGSNVSNSTTSSGSNHTAPEKSKVQVQTSARADLQASQLVASDGHDPGTDFKAAMGAFSFFAVLGTSAALVQGVCRRSAAQLDGYLYLSEA